MGYTLSIDLQYQVVRNVLKDYLEANALDNAIRLWEQQYSKQPAEKLSFFVFEIATTAQLRNVRKDILHDLELSLKQQQVKMQENIEPTPVQTSLTSVLWDEVNSSSLNVTAQDIHGIAVVDGRVLTEFLMLLMQDLKQRHATDLKKLCEEYFAEENLPQFIQHDVLNLIFKDGTLEVLQYDQDHIRRVINILYSILCEYDGPTKTDRLMVQTLASCERKYPTENIRLFL